MCKETCVFSTAVRDVLTHLAPCWIQGTVHSYIKQSGIQQSRHLILQFKGASPILKYFKIMHILDLPPCVC